MLKLPCELNDIDPLPKLGLKITAPEPAKPTPKDCWDCATLGDALGAVDIALEDASCASPVDDAISYALRHDPKIAERDHYLIQADRDAAWKLSIYNRI